MKQTTFASLAFERKKKQTRLERLLAEMEKVVPWAALLAVIEPHYPTGRCGRPPAMPLATMLRIYVMQKWYALSDPAMEDALYEVDSMRRFAGLDLTDYAMPDETTILKFRHLHEKHALNGQMMNIINDGLAQGQQAPPLTEANKRLNHKISSIRARFPQDRGCGLYARACARTFVAHPASQRAPERRRPDGGAPRITRGFQEILPCNDDHDGIPLDF
ncbi:transposase, partial [Thauera phenylacetica]|uniref:transposase n=1 Tax=Thauera phenylacetica TaxID=164400 RepID=UPI0039E34026